MDETEARSLAQSLGIDYEEYKNRIRGKEKEAEFIIILRSLGVLKHIEAYDEGFSHLTDEYTPDFRVELQDGYKMLLEVKHTDKDYFEISSGNLRRRMEYSERQNLPLRFAVSLKGKWGLFTTETLQKKRGKLESIDFIGCKSESFLDIELGTCSYMFNNEIKIKSVYSVNHRKGMGIRFDPYGELISYELYCDNRRIYRVKGKESSKLIYSMLLEALQDRVSNIHQDIVCNGNYTIITEYSDKNVPQMIPEYAFLLAPRNHLTHEVNCKNIRYDSISAIKERAFNFVNVLLVRALTSDLVNRGLDITVFRQYVMTSNL